MRNLIQALQYQLRQEDVDHPVLPLTEQLRQSIDYCLELAVTDQRDSAERLSDIRDAILGIDSAAREEQEAMSRDDSR